MIFGLVFEKNYLPHELNSIPQLIAQLYRMLGYKEKQVKNLEARSRVLHALFRFIRFDDIKSFNDELKHRYPNHCFQDLGPIQINNLIYLASDASIQSTTSRYITYIKTLIQGPTIVEQAAWGLASGSDLWTSPIWYVSQFPVIPALGNLASSLNRSKRFESIKDLISALALPGEEALTFGRSTELIGSAAKLAKITLAKFEETTIRGSLTNLPNPNLTSTVLSLISNDAYHTKYERHHGLVPGPLVKEKPKKDIYDAANWI
jgi:hypothetical protein